VAKWAADKAHDMSTIDHPVAWLRRRYGEWGRGSGTGSVNPGVSERSEASKNRVRKIEDIPDVLPPSILKRRVKEQSAGEGT
jgi:hypothetical protein